MFTRNRATLAIALFVLSPVFAASALTVSVPGELNAIVPSAAATASPTSTASSTTSVAVLQTLLATLQSELNALTTGRASSGTSTTTVAVTFTRVLSLGSKGADVTALQQILKAAGFYTYPTVTGYFGTLTEQALAAYQTAHGLDPVGYTGPKTRALLNGVANVSGSSGVAQPAAASPSASSPTTVATTSSSGIPPLFPIAAGYGGGGAVTTPPTISGTPSNMSVSATSPAGASVTYTTPSATDYYSESDAVSCSPAPGSTFALGMTTVTCSTTDKFGNSAHSSFSVTVQETTAPSISITAPSNGATVGGSSVTLTATATDTVAIASVQFEVGSTNIGAAVTSSPYATTWNSTGVSDGSYTLYAVAENTAGYYATSSVAISVRNSPPVISAITPNSIASSTETITWTTDEAANSQVSFGTTTGYGSASSSAALATSHSITLTGLTASTTYDFEVSSTDAEGNAATSSNQTFTTAAYNYYVDSVNGNDANPGTSPALAFQNITALPTITAGQSVALAYGSHWRQQLTINAANVTVAGYPTAYNSTNLPILDASDIIPNASFTKTAGYTNVYNTPTTTFTEGGSIAWANMWETGGPSDSSTGTFLANESSIGAVDLTACSYYIPTMTTSFMPTAEPIYVHSCDGTSVISNGYTYEVAQRAGLELNGSNETILNIEGRKNAYNDGSIVVDDSSLINNVIARDGGKHNAFAGQGSTVENSLLIDSYYALGNLLVVFDGAGSGLPFYSLKNIYQQDQKTDSTSEISAIIGHTSSGTMGNIYSSGDWFIAKNGAYLTGIDVGNAGALSVSSDYASQTYAMVQLSQNATIADSQFYQNISGPQTGTMFVGFLANNLSVTMSNVEMCGANYNGQIGSADYTGETLTISNSKLYALSGVGSYWSGFIYGTGANFSLTSNGNDYGNQSGNIYGYHLTGSGSTFTGDYNTYEKPSAAGGNTGVQSWSIAGTASSPLSNWMANVYPQDEHATSSGGNAIAACTLPTIPSVN